MSIKEIAAGVAGVVALVGLTWIFSANDLALRKVFAPAQEDVRRETFEHSKAYRDGMNQELRTLQFSYLKADPAVQPALADVIRHKAVGFPDNEMSPDVRAFIASINQ